MTEAAVWAWIEVQSHVLDVQLTLAEEVSHGDAGRITARGDSPRPIHVKADSSVIGQFIDVKITAADTFSLMADLV